MMTGILASVARSTTLTSAVLSIGASAMASRCEAIIESIILTSWFMSVSEAGPFQRISTSFSLAAFDRTGMHRLPEHVGGTFRNHANHFLVVAITGQQAPLPAGRRSNRFLVSFRELCRCLNFLPPGSI